MSNPCNLGPYPLSIDSEIEEAEVHSYLASSAYLNVPTIEAANRNSVAILQKTGLSLRLGLYFSPFSFSGKKLPCHDWKTPSFKADTFVYSLV